MGEGQGDKVVQGRGHQCPSPVTHLLRQERNPNKEGSPQDQECPEEVPLRIKETRRKMLLHPKAGDCLQGRRGNRKQDSELGEQGRAPPWR